jgi:hypothetical protein
VDREATSTSHFPLDSVNLITYRNVTILSSRVERRIVGAKTESEGEERVTRREAPAWGTWPRKTRYVSSEQRLLALSICLAFAWVMFGF